MATSIQLIKQGVNFSELWVRQMSIQSKVFFKGTETPKVWYYIKRDTTNITMKGSYLPRATYKTVKHQIFNNIPIKDIERKLVASRVNMNLTMEEINQFINELRVITTRKEE